MELKSLLILSLLLVIPLVNAEVVINEIMYNPPDNDNNKEYIEIYSDEPTNLTDYIIEDSKSSDVLELLNYYNSSYALIVEEDFDYSEINASVYSAGTTIGNNLNNDEDIIILRDSDGNILDIVFYSDEWGADDDGASIERIDFDGYSSDPDNWAESIEGGTPGEENSASSYCDWEISIILDSTVSEDPEFQVRVSNLREDEKIEFAVNRWIEFSNGTISTTYGLWDDEATSQKTTSTLSPNLKAGDAYIIKTNITYMNCTDIDVSNNFVSQMLFVPAEEEVVFTNSSIQILDSPSKADFGNIVKVELNAYRGDTSKYAVYAYVEEDDGTDVSEKSTLHLKSKFTNYTLTVPIQLKFNCNEKYKNDDYVLVVEGFGLRAEKEIELDGKSSNCEEEKIVYEEKIVEVEKEVNKTEETIKTEEQSIYSPITGKTVYISESSNRARNIIYLILFISVLLNIIFIRASR